MELEEDWLRKKRASIMAQCQEYMAQPAVHNPKGEIAGRSVTQIPASSKESRLFQNHLISTEEDRLRQNYANSIKKTEPWRFYE